MAAVEYTKESLELKLNDPAVKELSQAVMKDLQYLVTQYKNSKQREYLMYLTAWSIVSNVQADSYKPSDTINDEPF